MTHRYGVLQAHPEGTRLIGTSLRLQEAFEVASENPSYEIYDYERHEFVALPGVTSRAASDEEGLSDA